MVLKRTLANMFVAQAGTWDGLLLWKNVDVKDSFRVMGYLATAQQTFKGVDVYLGAAFARTLLEVHVTDKKELVKYVSPAAAKLISKTIEETRSEKTNDKVAVAIFLSQASKEEKEKMFEIVKKAEVTKTGMSALKSIMKDKPETTMVIEALRKLPVFDEKKQVEDKVSGTIDESRDQPKKHEGSMDLDRAVEVKEVDKKMIRPPSSGKGLKSQEVDRKK